MSGRAARMTRLSLDGSGFAYGNSTIAAVRRVVARLAKAIHGTATISSRSPPVAVTLRATFNRSAETVTRIRLEMISGRNQEARASDRGWPESRKTGRSRRGAGSTEQS